MSEFDSQAFALRARIEDDIAVSRLVVPAAFDVSLRIRKLADNPASSLDDIARAVQADPFLSARAVRLANAVMLNPYGIEVANVADAVRRIGLATLRCLAFALAAEQITQDQRTPEWRALASGLWMHSFDVACWAWAFARESRRIRPDTAMFAAMMTNIGSFFLLAKVGDYPALAAEPVRFAALVLNLRQRVGNALLDELGLPDEVGDACRMPATLTSWPPSTLVGVLTAARLASEVPNPFVRLAGDTDGSLPDTASALVDAHRDDATFAQAREMHASIQAALSP